ncbi:MAG: IS66 family transposase, partial [Dehalococcoidia bacterium]
EKRVAQLEQMVEQLRRGGKRQAAPFSKGPPKVDPKTPGRKSGEDYGTKAYRVAPPVIDEEYEASLPDRCPHCGERQMILEGVAAQYQTEIPRRPIHRKFNVVVGRCACCRRRIQGRHPLQTSDALGCAASQMGPDAQALIVHLNKEAGLSQGKISRFFKTCFGIDLTRGGACQSMLRSARRCEGTAHAIVRHVQASDWAVADETGWRIGGNLAWLHVAVTEQAVAYLVARERGYDAAKLLLGEGYCGKLIHDGWSPYLRFIHAIHQTCLAHLLRRCVERLEVATRGAVVFPRKVKALLMAALEVRDQRDAGQITAAAATRKADRLQKQIVKLTEPTKTNPANERLAGHLYRNQDHLFTFLRHKGIDATNWRAEQAIRPAVVNRKVWGGNRTEVGADAQSILMSVWQTARLRQIDPLRWLSDALRSYTSVPLLVPTPSG